MTEPTRYRRYDLVKEFVVAFAVVVVLTLALSAVLSSPDEKPITLSGWARADPADFVATAVAELDGTSATATYGPPYTDSPGAGQTIGPLALQRWAGVRHPIDTATDFVLTPLQSATSGDPGLRVALARYRAAPLSQRQAWATRYAAALAKAPGGAPRRVAPGPYGPVPVLLSRLLMLARNGGLDGALLSEGGARFYQTDYTKPLLFLSDGSYLADRADREHLSGDQWGMMNETGDYPGQAWLWLYTFWYQIPPFSSSDNADAWVWALMAVLTLALLLVPFIPGLRSIPRWIPVYRLIWREHYRRAGHRSSP
ncbi:hypothetical protein Athai_29310 [Actinocatenispora thailandica]|uniref:Uncharacterized protein n=1 Tax=Actinocatenispora thailandica TaxID=227318 RepID=A0A7R7DPI7_9ACTN|nr:hypothetical protein [Actinocatenispora thailandica]BCJ35428.1 hypothetical protein Athai_29310 [Actinocatenispora thailandica]